MEPEREAIRNAYALLGVQAYYTQHGATYRNPHEPIVRDVLAQAVERWRLDLRLVLDLACGSGEATLALRDLGAGSIEGADPYTGVAYRARTGQEAQPWSFEAIARGALAGRRYSLIVCSFGLHLAPPSWLPGLAYQLGLAAGALLVVTPHKRPHLNPAWGWILQDEFLRDRVRARYYTTTQSG
jgi:SAM-dependent methyltransferase